MSHRISLLKDLHFVTDENVEGNWISVDDFFKFLRENHTASDGIKDLRKSNIETEIKRHKNGLKLVDGQPAVSFTSILRYVFNHCDQLDICRRIINQIEQRLGLLNEVQNVSLSIKAVYTAVSKLSLKHSFLENNLLNSIEIDEHEIPSLYLHYKEDFTTLEWKKICVFELHFSKIFTESLNDSFENTVRQRWDFLEKLKVSKRFSKDLEELSKLTVKHRNRRKQAADEWFLIQIEAEKIHSPEVLEKQLVDYLKENGTFLSNVACVGCTDACEHDLSVHVFIELQTTDDELSDLITLITHFLQSQHGTKCHQIVFCIPGAFRKFISCDGKVERFHLRDVILNRKFNSEIFHCWNSRQQTEICRYQPEERCGRCFDLELPKPLHWKDFNYAQEWLLDVPLTIQIMLESFINNESLRKADNLSGFIKSKITKLYTLFDSLLNISNKNYIGVFQDISTQDLSMNYHSISTVFAITSTSGATLSLKEAEERMKAKANTDLCYYNTYLKKHKIEYDTEAGKIIGHVSLRECMLVLMMDNLVRLKYHADPEPGENRSQQICTLPITLKGVPKDSLDVVNWHDATLCDGDPLCPCKKDRKLGKEDISTHVLSLLPEEKDSQSKFQKLCTWGFSQIWDSIYKSDLWKRTCKAFKQNTDQQNIISTIENEFESSFASLVVQEQRKDCGELEEIETEISLHEDENNEDNDEDVEEPDNISDLLNNIQDCDVQQLIKRDFDEFEEEFFKPLDDSFSVNYSTLPTEMSIDESFSLLTVADENVETEKYNSEGVSLEKSNTDERKQETDRTRMVQLLFKKHAPPPLITRHPPPATGRDDDINKLKEFLDDVLTKADCRGDKALNTKILFAPDHKIGNNLLKLVDLKRYDVFLPEFPILHLR